MPECVIWHHFLHQSLVCYFALVRKGNSKDEVFKTEVKMISSMMQKDTNGLTDKGSRFQR